MLINYRRFYYSYLILSILPILIIGLFNFCIDPYNVFKSLTISGMNEIKPQKANHMRLFHAVELTRIKPRLIFLGTSRAQRLPINHPATKKFGTTYGVALPGGSLFEMRRYLEHAIYNQPDFKLVIIGLDFFAFGSKVNVAPGFKDDRLEKNGLTFDDAVSIIFSIDSFKDSRVTLKKNLDDSRRNNNKISHKNPKRFNKPKGIVKISQAVISSYFTSEDRYKNYILSDMHLDEYKKIVELCKRNNIELFSFISPVHATQLEAIRISKLWTTFEQWKRSIIEISPVWDFSGFNSITTEPLSNMMSNYVDSSHYNYQIGNLIFNRIFQYNETQIPYDFGIYIDDLYTLEIHLKRINQDYSLWSKNNQDQVNFVSNLATPMQ